MLSLRRREELLEAGVDQDRAGRGLAIADAVDRDDDFLHRPDRRPVDGLLGRSPVGLDLQGNSLDARRALDLDGRRDLPRLARALSP